MKQNSKNLLWIATSILLILFFVLKKIYVKKFMLTAIATGKMPTKSMLWNLYGSLSESFWLAFIIPIIALISAIQLTRYIIKNIKKLKQDFQAVSLIILIAEIIILIILLLVLLPNLWTAIVMILYLISGEGF